MTPPTPPSKSSASRRERSRRRTFQSERQEQARDNVHRLISTAKFRKSKPVKCELEEACQGLEDIIKEGEVSKQYNLLNSKFTFPVSALRLQESKTESPEGALDLLDDVKGEGIHSILQLSFVCYIVCYIVRYVNILLLQELMPWTAKSTTQALYTVLSSLYQVLSKSVMPKFYPVVKYESYNDKMPVNIHSLVM